MEPASRCFYLTKLSLPATSSNTSEILAGKQILVAEDEPALAQLLNSLLSPMKAARRSRQRRDRGP